MIQTLMDELPGLPELIAKLTGEWEKSAKLIYNKKLGRKVYTNGHFKGLDGRPITVSSSHAILNYALQSDEAIHMSYAYILVHKYMEEAGFCYGEDWNMLIFYHDEIQVECSPEHANHLGS